MWGFDYVLVVCVMALIVFIILGITTSDNYGWETAPMMLTVIFSIIVFILSLVCLTRKTGVKCYIQEIEEMRIVVNESYTGNSLNDVAITNKIIELNKDLAVAKASYKTCGIWSYYYGSDIMNVKPIKINK